MPQVSRRKLKKDIYKTISKKFGEMLTDLLRSKNPSAFANELLTSTERLMLCKRLMIIIMLLEHYPFLEIERTLKVTVQTIGRIYKKMNDGNFKELLQTIDQAKKDKDASFWQIFNILPQRVGMGRYNWLKKK